MKSIKTPNPRLLIKYTLTPRSMSSRTVQFLVIILGDFAYIIAIYVYLFIYGSDSQQYPVILDLQSVLYFKNIKIYFIEDVENNYLQSNF